MNKKIRENISGKQHAFNLIRFFARIASLERIKIAITVASGQ